MRITLPYKNPLFLAFLTAFLLTACNDAQTIKENELEEKTYLSKLLNVTVDNNDKFLNYPATIKAQQLSILSFEVNGKVKDIFVKEAQVVKAGEILAKLDQEDLQAKIESARSQYDNSDAEYQRALRLIKGNAISQSDLEAKESKKEVSKSSLLIAEKALSNSVLKAPYDGVVSLVVIKKQQVLQAGSEAVHIFGFGGMKATINLPSSIIAKTANQEAATNSYIVLDAAPKQQIPIVFKEASLEADTSSQTYPVTFTFNAPKNLVILPGMNAVVWFKDPTLSTLKSNIAIPLTAIGTDGEQKYVWIVDTESMTVSKKSVTIEPGIGTNIQIASGLEEGDTIVAAGISFLSEGMKVAAWSK